MACTVLLPPVEMVMFVRVKSETVKTNFRVTPSQVKVAVPSSVAVTVNPRSSSVSPTVSESLVWVIIRTLPSGAMSSKG